MTHNTPIAYEAHVLARLREEGWNGDVQTLRALATRGERLSQRWGNECSYEWASTEAYTSRTERQEKKLAEMAKDAGLSLFLQTDPRGAAVYVRNAPLPITDTDYSSVAHCLFYAR